MKRSRRFGPEAKDFIPASLLWTPGIHLYLCCVRKRRLLTDVSPLVVEGGKGRILPIPVSLRRVVICAWRTVDVCRLRLPSFNFSSPPLLSLSLSVRVCSCVCARVWMCVCVLFALASTCPVYKYRRDKLRPFGLHRMMRKVTEAAIKSLLLLFQQAAVSFSYYIRVEKHVSFTQFWSF